jgi:hypothetical protein
MALPGTDCTSHTSDTSRTPEELCTKADVPFPGISCLGSSYTVPARLSSGTPLTEATAVSLVTSLIANVNFSEKKDTNSDPTKLKPTQYLNNTKALQASISQEYCYYYKRYIAMLNNVLSVAAGLSNKSYYPKPTGNPPGDQLMTYQLNFRLNDILTVLKTLIKTRETSVNGYYGSDGLSGSVGTLNANINTAKSKLTSDSEALQNSNLQNDAQSAMIDYTIEKNKSSTNLLAVYGFMNIVAIGMIFYLYRTNKA